MRYKVLDTFSVGGNTSVTIAGNGEGLKNDILIRDSNETKYHILSVAMVSSRQPLELKGTTTILLEGIFNSDIIITE